MKIAYSRLRLWVAAFFCGNATVFLAVMVANPQFRLRGTYGLLVNGVLGHTVILPGLALICLVAGCRCAIVASGSAAAIVTDARGATVTTLWKTHRIDWCDLLRVRLSISTFRRTKTYSLKFDRADGRTISLPLAGLSIPKDEGEYRSLLQELSDRHLCAVRSSAAEPPRQSPTSNPKVEAPILPAFGRKIA